MTTKEQVLQSCTIDGTIVKLPNVQLDRKLYQEVAKSLELIGGKWKGGKIAGFVFATDPTDLLSQIANGEKRNLKKEFQFFATPQNIASLLVNLADLAELKETDTILEPSAGQGAIIREINKVTSVIIDCYELMDINIEILKKSRLKFKLIGQDFLQHKGKKYSKIIANPPFTKNQDIEHLMHMYNHLESKGRLVCITSESWIEGSSRKQVEFRNWLESKQHKIQFLEKGTFKESGTMVGACIVIIDKK